MMNVRDVRAALRQVRDEPPAETAGAGEGRGLEWILAPIERRIFAATHWGRGPLKVIRQAPRYYHPLLPEDGLEHALFAAAGVPGSVEIFSEGQRPMRVRGFAAVQEALNKRQSIRVDAIQRFCVELANLCRRLERELLCVVNVNMYFSPQSSQALQRHFDTHDVFVLQVHGRKKWRLFDSAVDSPLEYVPQLRCETQLRGRYRKERGRIAVSDAECRVTEEFTLESGDLLYLPRGHWHVAETESADYSCHLTVGAQPFTYLDLLTIALGQAASVEPRLRKSLPLSAALHPGSVKEAGARLQEVLAALPPVIDAERAMYELVETFVRSRPATTLGLLRPPPSRQVEALTLDREVRLRNGIICAAYSDASGAHLVFDTRKLTFAARFEPGCRFIAAMDRFRVRELPEALQDEEKLGLVRRLIEERLLETCGVSGAAAVADDNSGPDRVGWVPVRLEMKDARARVEWIRSVTPFREPMFAQSVARMRRESPPAPSRITGLGFLMRTRAAVPPRGFIFHVSRCGSTLVSNLTRLCEQNIVVSEPQVFGPLLMPPGDRGQLDAPKGVMRDRCIRGAMAAFGSSGTRNETGVIIKLTSWQILSMGVMRRLWPEVPCLVVIRDPVEVMVSCLKDEPGWLKLAQDPGSAARLFGWEARRIPQLSPEQRCAMGLGEFYRAALEQLGPRCRILDYSRIGEDSALQIARYFGYPGDSLDPEALKRCLATYSKDLKGEDAFACDGPRKQLAAGADLRMYAQEYARTAYEALMSRSEHHLAAGAQTSCTPWPAQGAAAAS